MQQKKEYTPCICFFLCDQEKLFYNYGQIKQRLHVRNTKLDPAAVFMTKSSTRHPPRSFFGRLFYGVMRSFWWVGWRMGLFGAIMFVAAWWVHYNTLPHWSALLDKRGGGSVIMLDRDGQIFAWRGQHFDRIKNPTQISLHLKNAIIATEDKGFYTHFGISPRGILGAMVINVREGRSPLSGHGGSTISQQVAKLLCLGRNYDAAFYKNQRAYEADCRRNSVWRKLKEIPFAIALESKYSKDEILTIYLNRVYLGAGAYGFEAASRRYFGKSASQVDASEAAMLAGLLVAPSYYAPTRNLQRAQQRANVVLALMRRQGYLNANAEVNAENHPAKLSGSANGAVSSYFADWVMTVLPDFFSQKTTEDVIVETTFDPTIQRAAEDALKHVFTTKVKKKGSKAQAAIVVMSKNGAVRAMVGGRELRQSGQLNRATQSKRQTGSIFKTFVYAAALADGYTPFSEISGAPITIKIRGARDWTPRNYKDETYGDMRFIDAYKQSVNTAAVRLSETIGRERAAIIAQNLGVSSPLKTTPAVALGVSDATLLEMTGAYAGIANNGYKVTPFALQSLRLKGTNRSLISQRTNGTNHQRVLNGTTVQSLLTMMREVIVSGTGQRAQLQGDDLQAIPIFGKTGTTQAARDAWFIGFSNRYVVGVWMGYDDNTPLVGVTGGGLPADIWRETMQIIN